MKMGWLDRLRSIQTEERVTHASGPTGRQRGTDLLPQVGNRAFYPVVRFPGHLPALRATVTLTCTPAATEGVSCNPKNVHVNVGEEKIRSGFDQTLSCIELTGSTFLTPGNSDCSGCT